MSAGGIECGTCGSRVLVLAAAYSTKRMQYEWAIKCGNGHVLVPSPTDVITISFEGQR